jgi:hypothetical protein
MNFPGPKAVLLVLPVLSLLYFENNSNNYSAGTNDTMLIIPNGKYVQGDRIKSYQ